MTEIGRCLQKKEKLARLADIRILDNRVITAHKEAIIKASGKQKNVGQSYFSLSNL